jgi:hypothetical protein
MNQKNINSKKYWEMRGSQDTEMCCERNCESLDKHVYGELKGIGNSGNPTAMYEILKKWPMVEEMKDHNGKNTWSLDDF